MSAFKDTAPLAYQVHAIAKRVAAKLANKERTYQPVRRGSFDVEDSRAKPGKPIGDGSLEAQDALSAIYRTGMERMNVEDLREGKHPRWTPMQISIGERVGRGIAKGEGNFAASMVGIAAELTRGCPKTVERTVAMMESDSILCHVTRTKKTGEPGVRGPQVAQECNNYYIDVEKLPETFLGPIKALMARGWAAIVGGLKAARAWIEAAAAARSIVACAEARKIRARRHAERLANMPVDGRIAIIQGAPTRWRDWDTPTLQEQATLDRMKAEGLF